MWKEEGNPHAAALIKLTPLNKHNRFMQGRVTLHSSVCDSTL